MDCLPGLSRAAWSTPGRGTLTRYKPNQPDEVNVFFAVNTQIHSMAPQCAGAPGSVFFKGIAPWLESAKQQYRPVPVFVCHHREADHSWEYCGHYEIANEESYHADAEIKEGEDEHGDVWSKNMDDEARDSFATRAAAAKHGWGSANWVDSNPDHEYVQGRTWLQIPEAERKEIVKQLYTKGLRHEDRIQLRFVRYDEELYQALASNELHPQNLKKVNMKKAAGS